jgi:1-deoxy-D-xylulose-5-phosphate reductoisomerase
MKKIFILGSTGSIGSQALDVISNNKDKFELVGISCNSSIHKFIEQILKFKPKFVVMENEALLAAVKTKTAHTGCQFISGKDCYIEAVNEIGRIDCLVSAISTSAGISPTLEMMRYTKKLAIANKESVVCAGHLLKNIAFENNIEIVPIDSEHNSLYRLLAGVKKSDIERVLLTASGGMFCDKTEKEFQDITLADAVNHPNWSMGMKNTIDSNSMANKALEIMEAGVLFDLNYKQIDAVIERSSICHGMAEMKDGSVHSFMSKPDMKNHISHAMSGEIIDNKLQRIDFSKSVNLLFSQIPKYFKPFYLGKWALKSGIIYNNIFNFANEVAVERFVAGDILFYQIGSLIESALAVDFKAGKLENVDDILALKSEVYNYCFSYKI